MHYSLTSREVIADSVECAVQGHQFDAMVLIPSCDKIVPACLSQRAVSEHSTVLISGPMLAGRRPLWRNEPTSTRSLMPWAR